MALREQDLDLVDMGVPARVSQRSTARRRRPVHDRAPARRSTVVLLQVVTLGLLIAAWEVAVRVGLIDPFFWSQPSEVVREGRAYIPSAAARADALFTLRSTLIGFVIGNTIGASIGLSLWWSRLGARVVEPLIVSVHAIPKLAFAPLFVIVFGLGTQSKVAMVVALTVVSAALSSHAGTKAVDPDLVALLRSLGASRLQVFRLVVLPSSAPWILAVMRLNIGLALTGAIVGEMVGSREGLGRMIFHAGTVYNVGKVWVGALLLAVLAMGMYATIGWLERRVLGGFHLSDGGSTRR
ncbi:MAG TPA: ABC transporter permease [Acidimicrobiaceae bacterium]|nr:ABC transporter permease [Acidimicrobiaceae bacterium]